MKRKSKLFFRKFGLELEFSTPLNKVSKIIKKIIPKIYGKNKLVISNPTSYNNRNSKFKKWELKYDGSTESELTTPISTQVNFDKISRILDELKDKVKQTNKDSVHIHMQVNDVPKHNIIAAWIEIEETILKCFPKHRRNNSYCQKLIHVKKYKKISDFFIDVESEANVHHSIISLNYYDDRKTLEFRMMEGNCNKDDIVPWIKFCMLFLNYAKTIDPVEIICRRKKIKLNITSMIELLKIEDEEVIDFLKRRAKRFK